jgi:hypothetical protein
MAVQGINYKHTLSSTPCEAHLVKTPCRKAHLINHTLSIKPCRPKLAYHTLSSTPYQAHFANSTLSIKPCREQLVK